MFEERLREQKERHDGGNKWIGTGGTSPFGTRRRSPRRASASAAGRRTRSAMQTRRRARVPGLPQRPRRSTCARSRSRCASCARSSREGADDELDLDGTIDATAKNAGELEVVTRPPRRPNTRVILMMDVGGSMDPYAQLVSRSSPRPSKATHFKELRTYYFHNCVYGQVYKDRALRRAGARPRPASHECGPHYKLIMVGDALMAPYELLRPEARSISGTSNSVAGHPLAHDAAAALRAQRAGSTPSRRTTGRATPSSTCGRSSRCSRSRSTASARP